MCFRIYEKENWGDRRGSNPRQPVPQTGALPTELRPPTEDVKCRTLYSQRQASGSKLEAFQPSVYRGCCFIGGGVSGFCRVL